MINGHTSYQTNTNAETCTRPINATVIDDAVRPGIFQKSTRVGAPSQRRVLITGLAGTGKSTLCAYFNQTGYEAYDMESIPGLFRHIDRQTDSQCQSYDGGNIEDVIASRWLCDHAALDNLLMRQQAPLAFYFAYAGEQGNMLKRFDMTLVLSVSAPVLRRRLRNRTTGYGSSDDVIDYTIAGLGWYENHITEQGATVINGDRPLADVATTILNQINAAADGMSKEIVSRQ